MAKTIDNLSYYDILNVDRDAPAADIRATYRRLMQQHGNHPDLGGDTTTAALINKAYSVLGDPERRTEYDARLDILRLVAQGFADDTDLETTEAESDRTIDPTRACIFCETAHDHGVISDGDAQCENCGSPLHAADSLRDERADQRAVARIRKDLDITFFTHWPQTRGFAGRTEDISPNGLRLVTKRPLRPGQRIKLVSTVVEAVGEIAHCISRRSGWQTEYVAGVSFVTLRFVRSAGGFLSQRV